MMVELLLVETRENSHGNKNMHENDGCNSSLNGFQFAVIILYYTALYSSYCKFMVKLN